MRLTEKIDPLQGLDEYEAFFDQTVLTFSEHIEGWKFYPEILQFYPDALFILNTRPKKHWIESRIKHRYDDMVSKFMWLYGYTTQQEVIDHWDRDWENQHQKVKAEIPEDQLLIFNIESDDQRCIDKFLGHTNAEIGTVVVGVRPPALYREVRRLLPEAVRRKIPNEAKQKAKLYFRRYFR